PPRLPLSIGPGELAARRLAARGEAPPSGDARARLHALSQAARAHATARPLPLGRRAADARHRPRPYVAPEAPDAGRAVPRPVAPGGRSDRRDQPPPARGWRHAPLRRAERRARPVARRSRLRPRERPDRDRGLGQVAAPPRRGPKGLPGRVG